MRVQAVGESEKKRKFVFSVATAQATPPHTYPGPRTYPTPGPAATRMDPIRTVKFRRVVPAVPTPALPGCRVPGAQLAGGRLGCAIRRAHTASMEAGGGRELSSPYGSMVPFYSTVYCTLCGTL